MAMLQLNLENLAELDDGRVAIAFGQALKRAADDCIDRPGDKKARVISLEAHVIPVIDADTGQCEGAHIEFQIKHKLPVRKSKTYSFEIKKGGHLWFSSESPDDVDQLTFADVDPETGKARRTRKDAE